MPELIASSAPASVLGGHRMVELEGSPAGSELDGPCLVHEKEAGSL